MPRCQSREQVERAARLYHRVSDASRALGITSRSSSRMCRKHGMQTPWRRRHGRNTTTASSIHG